jgi:hypothetical protein
MKSISHKNPEIIETRDFQDFKILVIEFIAENPGVKWSGLRQQFPNKETWLELIVYHLPIVCEKTYVEIFRYDATKTDCKIVAEKFGIASGGAVRVLPSWQNFGK